MKYQFSDRNLQESFEKKVTISL